MERRFAAKPAAPVLSRSRRVEALHGIMGKWLWESGKPVFGFPLFHGLVAGAVGMWESRVLCEISKERWEEGKSAPSKGSDPKGGAGNTGGSSMGHRRTA